jgi:DNA-binding NtrC family response regulator
MSSTPQQQTIVVIDSNQRVLIDTRSALEGAGFRVVTHSRSTGCVALILQEKPDLVLLDLNMPFVAGETIAKLFGKAQPNSSTIVLLYSSLSREILEAKVRSCSAHGFVQKARDTYHLVREVNSWLKRGQSSGKLRAARRVEIDDEALSRPSAARRALPSSPSSAEPRSELPHGEASQRGGDLLTEKPKVLFIDDDMGALSAFRREVQTEGYTVEFALSGTQALRRIISANPPALVICDLLMPNPGGAEVYERALESDPSWGRRFVFVTGAGLMPEVADFLAHFSGIVLAKPVGGDRLRTVIRDALAFLHRRSQAQA